MSPIVFGTNRSFKRWNTLSLAKELFIKDSLWRVARVGKSHKKYLVVLSVSKIVKNMISPVILNANLLFKRKNFSLIILITKYWRDCISLFQPSSANRPESPAYEEFLVQQKKRALEWRTNREAKKTKAQYASPTDDWDNREDTVSVLRQQLATKTEECYELKSKLESIEAVNSQILRNQVEMQDNVFKVRFVILV